MGCVCGSGDREELEKYIEFFFLFFFIMIECVFILTPCNINAISTLIVMNNIRKELVMIAAHYGDQIIANHNTKSIKITNIDSNRQQIREQNQSQLVILILTI